MACRDRCTLLGSMRVGFTIACPFVHDWGRAPGSSEDDGGLQGFELKRRGELKLIKVFQSEVPTFCLTLHVHFVPPEMTMRSCSVQQQAQETRRSHHGISHAQLFYCQPNYFPAGTGRMSSEKKTHTHIYRLWHCEADPRPLDPFRLGGHPINVLGPTGLYA